jgi:hypothetical protein
MSMRTISSLHALLAVSICWATGAAAEPPSRGLADSRIEALTAQVRELLAESPQPHLDPWKPHRERPEAFSVVPGEKLTYAERLTAMALTGLANREGPRLFIRGHFAFNADADRFWLARLAGQYGMHHREMCLDGALRQFRDAVRGAVICDDRVPATEVVALTLAGAFRLVPALPEMEARLKAAGIPVVLDLRGAWTDHVEAQQWVFDLVGPRLSDQLIGFLDVRNKALWGVADYLVMYGGLVADLSSDRAKCPAEYELRDKALARLKPGSIVWGWTCHDNESLHVAHASRHGLRVLCSTNCPNLSLLAQVAPKNAEYRQRSPAASSRTVEKKLYLTFVLSDGDSIPILLTRQWYRWDDPARGKVPFGWEHQPLLADLAPAVFEYYYETMTDKDRLICGPSGAGYTHPGEMPNLDWFIGETSEHLRRTDLHSIGVCADWDEEAARAMLRGVPEAIGCFHGWGEKSNRKMLLDRGKPYVPYWLCLERPEQSPNKTKDAAYFAAEAAKLRRIVERSGLPCFVAAHLSCYWSTPSDVPKLLEALGDDIPHEVLLPDQFLQTVTDYHKDKVVLEPIEQVQFMPGATTSLVLNLTSTRSQATECVLRLEAPLGATVEPKSTRVALEPFGAARVPVRLRADAEVAAESLTVTLDFAGRSVEHKLPVDCLPPVHPLPEGLSLCSVWEAGRLTHSTGTAVDDPEAFAGKAWQAIPGKHRAGTHLAWGPYEELPPGRYAVAFRLKSEGQDSAPVATLDVFNFWLSKEGKNGTYAHKTLRAQDLAKPGHYADYWLDFEHGTTGKVEYRVWWHGGSPLSLDRVVVFRRP